MLRVAAIVMIAAMGSASAQQSVPKTVRQANAGETCATFQISCLEWCNKNQIRSTDANQACRAQCPKYQAICEQTGVWSTPLGTTEVRGLPPK
jgi:hypothetical protein